MNSKTFKIVSFSCIGLILALFMTVSIVAGVLSETITFFLVGYTTDASDEDVAATRDAGEDLAKLILAEGTVLAQNEDNTLPLDSDSVPKVNVLGWGVTQWVAGGSGSGRVVNSSGKLTAETTILEALDDYGIEYNTEIIDFYSSYQSTRPYFDTGTLSTYDYEYYRLYEPDINEDYDDYDKAIMTQYSDTALVVITRVAGESTDAPKVQYKNVYNSTSDVTDETRTYLEISTEEEALLEYAGATFDNVIVIINSVNTMELGFMETIDGLDACLVVGGTGINAASVIPEIIYGDINPSGKFADTYAYELQTAASYANSGIDGTQSYANDVSTLSSLYPYTTNNANVSDNAKYERISYVDYVEDIYVGYKWYETADAEEYWDDVNNEYGKGYDGVVQYPFGYGLSYTTFEKEIVDISDTSGSTIAYGDTISVTVRVTNTGDVDGKEVVQLYADLPYTSGGIEKSASNLIAFDKTETLEPGEYQDIVLEFEVEDLASYDCYDKNNNSFKGYELEAGEYEIKLMENSHVDTEVGVYANSVNYSNVITYNIEDTKITTDSVSGGEISNKFTGDDAIDGISLDGSDSDGGIVYLTRSDFEGTFPSELATAREMSQNVIDTNDLYSTADEAAAWADDSDVMPKSGEDNGLSAYDSSGAITELGLALGADYDDERWEDLLDQITEAEKLNVTLHGYVNTQAIASIGKQKNSDVDGPNQVGSFNVSVRGVGYPNTTVMAQSFDPSLAYDFGISMGTEAATLGYDGLYAPGLNMHRTPFGGRNYEYYSEDSTLTGVMVSNAVKGIKNTGTYTYLKHLALYEQESYRDSLYTWCTEQALREIYLKPFRYAIQEGGSTGIMTSYNRVGAVWASASSALIDGVIRDEFGFQGTILTDYADNHAFMNMDDAIRHGSDLWMDGWLNNGTYTWETSSASMQLALRRATKNIVYTGLNALYTNSVYNADEDTTPIIKGTKTMGFAWWIPVLVAIDAVVLIGCSIWAIFVIKRKEKGVPIE